MNTEILIQIGRIAYINYGPDSQKLAIVRDFINTKKVIIDSPNGTVQRQVIPVKRLEPTKFILKNFTKDSDIREYKEKFQKATDLFSQSGKGKKILKQKLRQNLTDFERFKVMTLRRQLSKAIKTQLNKKRSN